MADFYQTGVVTTLHKLGEVNLERLEAELSWYSQERPIALVLPSLFSELQGEALKGIVEELKGAKYIASVIVSLGNANREEFEYAKKFFSVLPQRTRLIWTDGEHIQSILQAIREAGLQVGEAGKGRSVWIAWGYVLSLPDFHVIALHDCDIVTYNRALVARLCYPVTNPNLDYEFCKGYYSRVTDRMHGRATRLLITPLLRSLQRVFGYLPFLVFLDSFRYPLSGEFSMHTDLARVTRIPADWGLEIGLLSEVYRNVAPKRVCQVDIIDQYEHKHQPLSPDDPSKGLLKMCIDICKSLFRNLASEGMVFSEGVFNTITATYVRTAHEMLKRYEDDAAINGLVFDRHEESLAVDTFTKGIKIAAKTFMEDPLGIPLIPSWDRVTSAIPDILRRLREAVEEDNR